MDHRANGNDEMSFQRNSSSADTAIKLTKKKENFYNVAQACIAYYINCGCQTADVNQWQPIMASERSCDAPCTSSDINS